MRKVAAIVKRVAADFKADDVTSMSAALAFYTALSLAPLVVIVLSIAGLIWSEADVQHELVRQATRLVGKSGAETVQTIMESASRQDQKGLSAILAALGLLFGATTVFAQLQSSLNKVWNVEVEPSGLGGLWDFLRKRLLSLGMILAIAFLLLVSLMFSAVLGFAAGSSRLEMPGGDSTWAVVNFILSFAVYTAIFTAMHRFLPDVKITWKDGLIGGTITAALFVLGKELLGWYLGQASVASAYGAAGSLFLVLLWVNYSSLILFIGAELTQAMVAELHHPVEVQTEVGARPDTTDQEKPEKAIAN